MPAIAGAPASRPVSASKRRPGGSFLGDRAGYAAFDRGSPYGGAQHGGGLVRQASAPSLGLTHHGVSPARGADSYARLGPAGGMENSYVGASGLRRAASTSGLHQRDRPPGMRTGPSSSAPRRRPYDSSPMRSVGMGERFDSSFARPGAGGTSVQPRADALQLEGRLTDQLRAHSMSSADLPHRAGYGGGGNSRFGQVHESKYSTPNVHFDRRTGASPASWHDKRLMRRGGPPEASPPPSVGESVYSRQSEHRRPPRGDESFHKGYHYADSRASPSVAQHHSSLRITAPDDTLSETRLKIYSDIFEDVIERDKVFGSLLRKIKTAYDMLLLQGRQQEVPPLPHEDGRFDDSRLGGRSFQQSFNQSGQSFHFHAHGFPSRSEASEMQRENRVLKDLVERLHLELEEAVRREQRWKHKCAKMKVRQAAEVRAPAPPARAAEWLEGRSYHEIPAASPQNQHPGQPYPHGVGQNPMQEDPHLAARPQMSAAEWLYGENPAVEYRNQKQSGPAVPNGGSASIMAEGAPTTQGGAQRAPSVFHASRREPDALNEGGLLSLSSISPQTSPPLPHDSFGGNESDDSGMLPQRPEKPYVRPPNVPCLDFARLRELQAQEAEEEEEYDEAVEVDNDYPEHHHGHQQQLGAAAGADNNYSSKWGFIDADENYNYAQLDPAQRRQLGFDDGEEEEDHDEDCGAATDGGEHDDDYYSGFRTD